MAKRYRAYCFTICNYTEEDVESVKTADCRYIVAGYETAPSTGTPHIQGYVYFDSLKSTGQACKALGGRAHVTNARGTPDENYKYCSKDGELVVEKGTKPKQGKRIDLEQAYETISKSFKIRDLLKDGCPSSSVLRSMEIYIKYMEKPRSWKPIVKWFWGATGTGKTRTAFEEAGVDAYVIGANLKWWEGYDGHENVIIDDFREEQCSFAYLLRILDRYELRIEVKGSSRELVAKNIWITSIYPPDHVYRITREPIDQLLRRLDEIRLFKNNE